MSESKETILISEDKKKTPYSNAVKKIKLADELYKLAFEIKKSFLKKKNPTLNEKEICKLTHAAISEENK